MLIVIFWHSMIYKVPGWQIYSVFTAPVMIPLFFFISGYLFNKEDLDFKTFIGNIIKRIVVPWLFLSLKWVYLCVSIVKGDWNALGEHFVRLLSGKDFWYMPCFIFAEIFWFLINKYVRKVHFVFIVVGSCFVVGLVFSHYDILNYAMINRALVVQLYMLIGLLYKKYKDKIGLNKKLGWFGVVGYIVLGIIAISVWPNEYIDVHKNLYFNIPYCLVMIFIGCNLIFWELEGHNRSNKILAFIGKNTLVYYMLSDYCVTVLKKMCGVIGINFVADLKWAIIETVWACITCGILALILNRFFPILVGKNRVRSEY